MAGDGEENADDPASPFLGRDDCEDGDFERWMAGDGEENADDPAYEGDGDE